MPQKMVEAFILTSLTGKGPPGKSLEKFAVDLIDMKAHDKFYQNWMMIIMIMHIRPRAFYQVH